MRGGGRGWKRPRGDDGGDGGRRRAAPLGSMATGSNFYQMILTLVHLSNRDSPGRKKVKPGGRVAQGQARRQVAENYVNDCRGYSVNNVTDAIWLMAHEAQAQGRYDEFLELLFLIFLGFLDEEPEGSDWHPDDDDYPDMSSGRSGAGASAAAR